MTDDPAMHTLPIDPEDLATPSPKGRLSWNSDVNGEPFSNLLAGAYDCTEALGEDAATVVEILHKRVMLALDAGIVAPKTAWKLLTKALPAHHLGEALMDQGGPLATRLLQHALPFLPELRDRDLPTSVYHLPYHAFGKLRALGLAYGATMDAKDAAKRWLCYGAPYGRDVWVSYHPRANPFLSYWAEHGLWLPGHHHHSPLRAEARESTFDLAVQAVHALGKKGHLTQGVADAIRHKRGHWAVGLALLRVGIPPHALSYTGSTPFGMFPEPWRKAIAPMFTPGRDTAHATLLYQAKLAAMPDVPTLLALAERPAPETLQDALGL